MYRDLDYCSSANKGSGYFVLPNRLISFNPRQSFLVPNALGLVHMCRGTRSEGSLMMGYNAIERDIYPNIMQLFGHFDFDHILGRTRIGI